MMSASSIFATTPTMRWGSGLIMPAAYLSLGSVHRMCRSTADWPGNNRSATLLLTITTGSASLPSAWGKARPPGTGIPPIGLGEVAPLEKRNPQRAEVARGNAAEPCTQIFLAALTGSPLDRELQSELEHPGIAPRGHKAGCGAFHTRQCTHHALGLLVELGRLF